MGSISIPFLSPSRAVIMMMDDGVCVHKVAGGQATFIGGILWRNTELEEKLADMIRQTGSNSVLILNDAVEQHYRKEKIVIPTAFDKANIIKRRLSVAFPNYPMRAAVELKEATAIAKAQADKSAEKGNVYLFAAAPSTESFSRVIRSIARTDCSIQGYALLPIESAGMVKALSQKLAGRWGGTSGAAWSVLIGQHRGGGLRQIVVRGNELALTRVTPIEEPKEGLAEVWAADVSQELQATLSYLSRFGYVPEDGLNIIVLGEPQGTELLEGMVSVPCNFESLTPAEAAHQLGLKFNKDDGSHFADGLHSAWAGKKMSLALSLSSREISDVAGPRRAAAAIMLGLCLAFGGVLYQTSNEAQQLYFDTKNLEVAKLRLAEIERIYQEEIERKKAMGVDVNLIKGALDIDNRIKAQHIDVLSLLKEISRDLNVLRMDGFEFVNGGDVLWKAQTPDQQSPVRAAKFKLKFSFAGNINPKDGNKEMYDLASRLEERLKPLGYTAKVSEPLQNLTYTGEVDKEVGLTASKRAMTERFNAEIYIQKVSNVQKSGQ
jgi:hypothetical protein